MSSSGESELGAYERLAIASTFISAGLLTLAYFVVAAFQGIETNLEGFLLSVLANLVATLIVLGASLTVLRLIVAARRQNDIDELQAVTLAAFRQALGIGESAHHENASLSQTLIAEIQLAIAEGRLSVPGEPSIRPRTAGMIDDQRRQIILHILHATSLALIYPRPPLQAEFRAFCHLADKSKKTLRPEIMWSFSQHADYNAEIPYEGPESEPFVIAQAFRRVEMVRKNLPANHLSMYPARLRSKIKPELRGVLAVPICDYETGSNEEPIGTISIDSKERLDVLGFDDDRVRDVLVWCAKAVYQVLTMSRNSDSESGDSD